MYFVRKEWVESWHSRGYPTRFLADRDSAMTGRSGVSILWPVEIETLIGYFMSVGYHVKFSQQARRLLTLFLFLEYQATQNEN